MMTHDIHTWTEQQPSNVLVLGVECILSTLHSTYYSTDRFVWYPFDPEETYPISDSIPINNISISTLDNNKSTHHKSTPCPDLPYNRLPYKGFVLY